MSRFASLQGLGATNCFLCESVVQTQRQDVDHEGVITGRDGFSLRSSIADPQGVALFPLQSIYIHEICFKKILFSIFNNEAKIVFLCGKILIIF
jgi:hypothetical protein